MMELSIRTLYVVPHGLFFEEMRRGLLAIPIIHVKPTRLRSGELLTPERPSHDIALNAHRPTTDEVARPIRGRTPVAALK
jgi:hypothetical protein